MRIDPNRSDQARPDVRRSGRRRPARTIATSAAATSRGTAEMLLVHGIGRTVNIEQIENIVIRAEGRRADPRPRRGRRRRSATRFAAAPSPPTARAKSSRPRLHADGREQPRGDRTRSKRRWRRSRPRCRRASKSRRSTTARNWSITSSKPSEQNLFEGGLLVDRRAVHVPGQPAGRPDRGPGDSAVDAVCLLRHAAVRHRRQPAQPGRDRLRSGRRQLGGDDRELRAATVARHPARTDQAGRRARRGRRGSQADDVRRTDHHDRLPADPDAGRRRRQAVPADGADGDLRPGRLDDPVADADAGAGQLPAAQTAGRTRTAADPLDQAALPAGAALHDAPQARRDRLRAVRAGRRFRHDRPESGQRVRSQAVRRRDRHQRRAAGRHRSRRVDPLQHADGTGDPAASSPTKSNTSGAASAARKSRPIRWESN